MSAEERATGEPAEMLGYLVKQTHLRLSALADEALEPSGLDRKEFAVLRVIDAGESVSQQQLAATLGVDPTTMVALIDALEAKGLAARRADPRDRRRNAVELTAAGRKSFSDASAAYSTAIDGFLSPLTSAESSTLHSLLRSLIAG